MIVERATHHYRPMQAKVLADRLRRKLARMGFRLQKSRTQDPDALLCGGYQIVDPEHGGLVAGWRYPGDSRGFGMALEDVRRWIDEAELPKSTQPKGLAAR